VVQGTILFFDRMRGYGFIVPSTGGDDLFFHYSQISVTGPKRLDKGQAVSYEIGNNRRTGKPMGLNITPAIGGNHSERTN
jgi:CspA family cold shock protein